MKLEKFIWNNGTKNNPIVLTDDEINTLLTLHKDYDIEFNVSGYVTTSTNKIQKYLKYEIEQAYPNLIITAQVINDNITIGLRTTEINEGDSIVCYNKSIGLDLKYIRAKFTHKINITSGTIDEQSIIDSISYNHNNNLIVTQVPRFNSSWTDEVTVKFYPFYEDSSTNNAITYKFTVKAIAIENVNIEIRDKYYVDENILKLQFTYNPTNNTKSNYIVKKTTINNITYDYTNGYKLTKEEILNINSIIKVFDIEVLTLKKTISIVKRKIDIYKLSNNDNTLTINKIKKYIIHDSDNLVIEDIRKNITFWRGKIKNKKLNIKQVSNFDLSKYADGTEITDYDQNNIFTFTNYNGFAYKFEYDDDSSENAIGLKDILIYITADITNLNNEQWNIIPKDYFITTHSVLFTKDEFVMKSLWHNYEVSEYQFSIVYEIPYNTVINVISNSGYKGLDQLEVEYIIVLFWLYYELNNCSIINSNSLTPSDEKLDSYGNTNTIFIENRESDNALIKYSNFFGLVNILTGYCLNYYSMSKGGGNPYNDIDKAVCDITVIYRNKKYTYHSSGRSTNIPIFEIKDTHIFPVLAYYVDGEKPSYSQKNNDNYGTLVSNNPYIYDNEKGYISGFHCTSSTYSTNKFLNFYSAERWSSKTRLYYQGEYEIIE